MDGGGFFLFLFFISIFFKMLKPLFRNIYVKYQEKKMAKR